MRRLTRALALRLLALGVAALSSTAIADEGPATGAVDVQTDDVDVQETEVTESAPLRYAFELVLRHENELPVPPSTFSDLLTRGAAITPWTGVRGGIRGALSEATFWGVDGTLGTSQAGFGGGTANETNRQVLALLGAHYGYGWGLGRARFSLLGLGEVGGTAGFRTLTVLGETAWSPLLATSLHAGAGFLFELGNVQVRTQCLGGVTGLTPTSMCSIGLGGWL